jgi:DNA-binding transcriptional regulator GbsR (MarR family)
VAEGEEAVDPRRGLEDRFLAVWARASGLWGVPPTHARIHGLLFLARRPLDAGTIQARLGISHGACVTGLGDLVARGAVRRVRVPGLRRAKFATDPDGWKWLHRGLRERRERDLGPVLEAGRETAAFAEEAVRRARAERRPGVRDLVQTRDRILASTRFLGELAAVIDAFLELGGARPRGARRARAGSRGAGTPGDGAGA